MVSSSNSRARMLASSAGRSSRSASVRRAGSIEASRRAHNEREKTPQLLDTLRAGESIALVSDAGTPLISDPGQTLVSAARDAGIRVEAIPGPSAIMAALSSSGLKAPEFVFLGFP